MQRSSGQGWGWIGIDLSCPAPPAPFCCFAKGQSSGAAGIVSQNLHRQIPLSLPIWLSVLCTVVLASLNLRCMKYIYICGGVRDFKNKSKFPRDVHHVGNLALSVNHLNSLESQLAYRWRLTINYSHMVLWNNKRERILFSIQRAWNC